MKKLLLLAISVLALSNVCCNDNQTGTPQDTTPDPDFVGNWEGMLPALNPFLKDSVRIYVNIQQYYSLSAVYASSGDSAIRHEGTWSASGDTILLQGTNCAIIDTALGEMKEIDCGAPISLVPLIRNDTMYVSGSDLAPVAQAVGIDISTFGDILKAWTIPMWRK